MWYLGFEISRDASPSLSNNYMTFKSSKRALRRFHRNRLLKKRKNYWGLADNELADFVTTQKLANTPKPCSCFMCGNPRKYFNEKKKQERIWEEQSRQHTHQLEPINFHSKKQ